MAGVECQYDFTHRERGLAVVIVNKNFPADCGLKNRRGWKKDMTRMKTFFKSLDFRVKCYKDLTGVSMIQKIFKATQDERNRDADCFACVISTHGSEEEEKRRHSAVGKSVYQHCVYGSDGLPVFINDIMAVVQEETSPHLSGKPKLFFIQACRSRHDDSKPKYDFGVVINDQRAEKNPMKRELSVLDMPDQSENGFAMGDFHGVVTHDTESDEETLGNDRSDDEWNSDDPDSDSDTESDSDVSRLYDVEDPKASPDTHEPPPMPVDVVPILCPMDCLIMYPVTSGKIAFTNPVRGSYLLSYMYSKMDSLLKRRELLPYLTEVVREVAKYDYNPEFKPDKMTVDEFYNCPLKTSACIVHRLTSDIVFIPKKHKHVIGQLIDRIGQLIDR